jgi:hypothetical protein
MSHSARSVFIYGIYVLIVGLVFTFAPSFLLKAINVTYVPEPWVRTVGVFMLGASIYFVFSGKLNIRPFFALTIYARFMSFAFYTMFVVTGLARVTILPFGIIDLIGALWTGFALRSESKRASA